MAGKARRAATLMATTSTLVLVGVLGVIEVSAVDSHIEAERSSSPARAVSVRPQAAEPIEPIEESGGQEATVEGEQPRAATPNPSTVEAVGAPPMSNSPQAASLVAEPVEQYQPTPPSEPPSSAMPASEDVRPGRDVSDESPSPISEPAEAAEPATAAPVPAMVELAPATGGADVDTTDTDDAQLMVIVTPDTTRTVVVPLTSDAKRDDAELAWIASAAQLAIATSVPTVVRGDSIDETVDPEPGDGSDSEIDALHAESNTRPAMDVFLRLEGLPGESHDGPAPNPDSGPQGPPAPPPPDAPNSCEPEVGPVCE